MARSNHHLLRFGSALKLAEPIWPLSVYGRLLHPTTTELTGTFAQKTLLSCNHAHFLNIWRTHLVPSYPKLASRQLLVTFLAGRKALLSRPPPDGLTAEQITTATRGSS